MENDEELLSFIEDEDENFNTETKGDVWKVLVVDDEKDIHRVTKIVVKDLVFDGKPIEVISAFSKKEAMEIFKNKKDIALALIDVVMEDRHSGLDLVKYVRDDLNNHMTRLVIRTGQPGYAPKKEIILNYDINDYREKTELTSERLITTILSGLRSYRDLLNLQQGNESLKLAFDFAINNAGNQNEKVFLEQSIDTVKNLAKSYDIEINASLCKKEDIGVECEIKNKNYINYKDDKNIYAIFNSNHEEPVILHLQPERPLPENLKNLLNLFLVHLSTADEKLRIHTELNNTMYEIIYTLSDIVETRSEETGDHVMRVSNITYELCLGLGLDEDTATKFKIASMLHDVGKIGIPDNILNKPGKLTDIEFEVMKGHTIIGHKILLNSKKDIFQIARNVARYHHENWDGSGYPDGLKGEQIPLEARITAVADVYDALASDRVYRKAWPADKVIDYIIGLKGIKFDPKIIEIFENNIVQYNSSSLL